MRICIPTSDDQGAGSYACDHFGTAPYFALVDLDTGALRMVRNPECHDHPHQCHHVKILRAHRVGAEVCKGMGRRALAGLQEAGIDVLAPARGTIRDIIGDVRAGRIRHLSAAHACRGGSKP